MKTVLRSLICVLLLCAGAADANILMLRTSSALSPDGSTISGGAGGSLTTAAGVWTFSPTQIGSDWPIQLNGADIDPSHAGDNAVQLYILNGGQLYQHTSVDTWYQYTGNLLAWTAVNDPRPGSGCLTGSICPPGTWTLVFNDEFNSNTVDTSKWNTTNTQGKGGDPLCNGTTLSESAATGLLTIFPAASCGGEISSLNTFGPGYYEARVKMDPADWELFWLIWTPPSDCQPITGGFEADIQESAPTGSPGNPPVGPQNNVHWGGYASCHQQSPTATASATDAFHVWGMLWDATNGLTFYRDGVQTKFLAGPVGSTAEFIIFTSVTYPGPATTGEQVDWVRYYQPSGGGGGTVPPMAQAAGFTQNVVTADFTGGGTYGSIGSWLRCGIDTSITTFGFYAYLGQGNDACAQFSIETDPTFGGHALRIHDTGSLPNNPNLGYGVMNNGFNSLSSAYYVKIVARITNAYDSIGCCVFDFWQIVADGFVFYSALLEDDFFETGGGGVIGQNQALWQYNGCVSGAADGQRCFGPGSDFGGGYSLDVTQYHTYERLGTTDGTSILWGCLVVDGVTTKTPCLSLQPTSTDMHALTDKNLVQVLSTSTTNFAPGNDASSYVKSFEIWACPNYASAGCTGTLVTHWP